VPANHNWHHPIHARASWVEAQTVAINAGLRESANSHLLDPINSPFGTPIIKLPTRVTRQCGPSEAFDFEAGVGRSELVAKRLELLRELVPRATHIAVLVNPGNATTTETALREAEAAARTMGLQIYAVRASTSSEINAAFATLAREKPDALFVANDGFYSGRRVQLANLASRHALPAAFHSREIVEVGGLLSYGTNIADAYRLMGRAPKAGSPLIVIPTASSCSKPSG
jgi:hypothetical protein